MHSHATISQTEQRDVSKLADFFMQISLYMANYEGGLYADHHVFCAFCVCVGMDFWSVEQVIIRMVCGPNQVPITTNHAYDTCGDIVIRPTYNPSLRNQVWQPSASCNTKVWWPGWTVFGGRKKVAHHQLLPPIIICQRFQSQSYRV